MASIVLAIFFLRRAPSDADRTTSSGTDGITRAVLPLSNYSGDSQQDCFADGMTEALIADLAQLEGLRVISRTAVMRYRARLATTLTLRDELGEAAWRGLYLLV